MNDYIIGSAAVLTAGPAATIVAATLHAQTDETLAPGIEAALLDFEASAPEELSRVVLVVKGWNRGRLTSGLIEPLLERRECSLGDLFEQLADATGARELHLFARWLPSESLCASLRGRGVTLVAHPLEAIRQAALISGQAYRRWSSPVRAA